VAEVDLEIAGRSYRVACRTGEEETLRHAAQLVDGKSREALAGLGVLSESRQLLFASLLLADQIIDNRAEEPGAAPDPALTGRVVRLAERLEQLADSLEKDAPKE
jgi:cell division protein ZapA